MADTSAQIALRVLGMHFAHPIPNNIIRYSMAREIFIEDHADLVRAYGEEIYTQAVENLIGSAYYDPRKPDHLERECQRLRLQAPSTPDTYEETGGDTMPWDK